MGRPLKDLTGQVFGRLTVLHRGEDYQSGFGPSSTRPQWMCRCECGNTKLVLGNHLKNGNVTSCGCLARERSSLRLKEQATKHGAYKTQTYKSWARMKTRCENPNYTSYANYGGRGIKVCERWQQFENFLEDMGEQPEGHSLDRIDVDGDYTPENCRWATREQQDRNRRNNVNITVGDKTMCLADWAKELGVKDATLRSRYKVDTWP